MNFPSCNRLVLEKHTSMNNRYHRMKLEEIKRSRHKEQKTSTKILDIKGRLQAAQKQKQIARNNAILLTKLNTIIDKPSQPIELPPPISKAQRTMHVDNCQPNLKQKSIYSLQKMNEQWRERKQHSRIASKIPNSNNPKQVTNQQSTIIPSPNRNLFEDMLKLFQELGMGQPSEDRLVQPQNLAQRMILCRKTINIEDVPYLVEISTAYKRVFLTGYNLNEISSPILRGRMTEQKARLLFSEYDFDFKIIASKIGVQGSKIFIKFPVKQTILSCNHQSSLDKDGNHLLEKQNKFIKRNYYEFMQRAKQTSKDKSKRIPNSEPTSQLRRRFHSLSEEQPTNSHQITVSKRYHLEKKDNLKRFSMAITMKKKLNDYKHNQTTDGRMVESMTNKCFRIKSKNRNKIADPSQEIVYDEFFVNSEARTERMDDQQTKKQFNAAYKPRKIQKLAEEQKSEQTSNRYKQDFDEEDPAEQAQPLNNQTIDWVKPNKENKKNQQYSEQSINPIQDVGDQLHQKSLNCASQSIQQYIDDFQS